MDGKRWERLRDVDLIVCGLSSPNTPKGAVGLPEKPQGVDLAEPDQCVIDR